MSAGVRVTDPDTSVDAWVSVQDHVNKQQALVLEMFRGNRGRVLNAYGVAVLTGMQQNCASKRLSELAAKGLVEDSGLRQRGSTTRRLIGWRVTDKGVRLFGASRA